MEQLTVPASSADHVWCKGVGVALGMALLSLAAPLLVALYNLCRRQHRIRRAFEAQDIPIIPCPALFYGNMPDLVAFREAALRHPMPKISHDITPRIFPHCYHWAQKYGAPYVFWFGPEACFTVTNAEDAKNILSTNSHHYPKLDLRPDIKALFGDGLVTLQASREKWAQHRRILSPAFSIDKLKAMIPTMEACITTAMEGWAVSIAKGQAIDVEEGFKSLTADVIARTAFGISFAEGKRVFELQNELQIVMDTLITSTYIPGARFFPTSFNRHSWKIHRDLKRCIRNVIHDREASVNLSNGGGSCGEDLLSLMLAASKHKLPASEKNLAMSTDEIIDECKTFFFAGHEATSTLLTWATLLLATNPEWQTRTREEVIAVCGRADMPLTAETINQLNIMGMVLNETLRLYPPATWTIRQALTDMRLGKVQIPKGTWVLLPFLLWHHDERYWGIDAKEFRPDRFCDGVVKASTVSGAFMPFSHGPHVCSGQMFALLEAKAVLATILRRYSFRLSPAYKHAPMTVLTLKPQFGMPILFEKL